MSSDRTIECPACGGEIVAGSKACMHCGISFVQQASSQGSPAQASKSFQLTPPKPASSNQGASGFFGLLVIGGIAWWILSGGKIGTILGTTSQSYNTDPSAASAIVPDSSSGANDLQIADSNVETGKFGNRMIVGKIKNTGGKQYSYAQVQFNLYDADKNLVGSAMANVNNLEPGGTWKFEAAMLEDKAVSYKLKDITAF